jgi:hypothetical protein
LCWIFKREKEKKEEKGQRGLKNLIHAIQERSSRFGNGEDICWGKVTLPICPACEDELLAFDLRVPCQPITLITMVKADM